MFPNTKNPLLVIGIGGAGLRVAARAKNQIMDMTPNGQLPDHVRFIALDAGYYDMDDRGFRGDEACNISNPQLSSQLMPMNRFMLPSFISNWLNPTLKSYGSGVDGAQGIRQIGRLNLFTSVDKVVSRILSALQQIAFMNAPIQVAITASLAGGTGAGAFLDVPYLVRYAAAQAGVADRLSIKGVMLGANLYAKLDEFSADFKLATGYAALEELTYCMEPANCHFVQQYSSSLAVSWDKPPYDECFIVDGIAADQSIARSLDCVLDDSANCIVKLFTAGDVPHAPEFGTTFAQRRTDPMWKQAYERLTAAGCSGILLWEGKKPN